MAGVGLNLSLWRYAPSVSWLWWNAFGFITTTAVILLLGRGTTEAAPSFDVPEEKRIWKLSYVALVVYAVVLIAFLTALPKLYG